MGYNRVKVTVSPYQKQEKMMKRGFTAVAIIWIISFLLSLATSVVVIWAIIQLVQHFTK